MFLWRLGPGPRRNDIGEGPLANVTPLGYKVWSYYGLPNTSYKHIQRVMDDARCTIHAFPSIAARRDLQR
jgi:hypothetical protein